MSLADGAPSITVQLRERRATNLFSLAARIAHAGSDPLDDERPLEPGHCTDDLGHKAAARRCEIDVVAEAHERDASCFKVCQAVH